MHACDECSGIYLNMLEMVIEIDVAEGTSWPSFASIYITHTLELANTPYTTLLIFLAVPLITISCCTLCT
jgi:hypothetical protein